MKITAVALATAMLWFLGSSVARADTITGDTVLIQGCSLVPLFPTDCTGSPFFTEHSTVVTNDASDVFTFGVSTTNVQSNSIIFGVGPGAGKGAFFNGVLVRGIDWVGVPGEFITGFTLTDNTMGLLPGDVHIFESGHAIALN